MKIVKPSVIFLIGSFVSLLLSCGSSLYILDSKLLLDMICKYFLPLCALVHLYLIISPKEIPKH